MAWVVTDVTTVPQGLDKQGLRVAREWTCARCPLILAVCGKVQPIPQECPGLEGPKSPQTPRRGGRHCPQAIGLPGTASSGGRGLGNGHRWHLRLRRKHVIQGSTLCHLRTCLPATSRPPKVGSLHSFLQTRQALPKGLPAGWQSGLSSAYSLPPPRHRPLHQPPSKRKWRKCPIPHLTHRAGGDTAGSQLALVIWDLPDP